MTTMMRRIGFLILLVGIGSQHRGSLRGEDAAKPQPKAEAPAVEMNERERAFAEMLSGAVLVGKFTIDGQADGSLAAEKYTINRAFKKQGHDWVVEARIIYGQVDLPVPVPVHVDWADETAVLSVTDLSIPLLGEKFGARILFHEGRYAGTWSHDKVGGHFFGKVERQEKK